MPKQRRREQQHLRQESARRRSYKTGGTAPNEVYKPGFPMNIFGNIKLFAVIGVVIAVILVVSAAFTTRGTDTQASDVPTNTPTNTVDPSTTPSPSVSPTPDPFRYSAAEQVIDAEQYNYRAIVKTSKGDFVIELDAENAPNTVNSFVFLAEKGYFDGITFHRIVENFVAQSGDRTGTGSGGPGYTTNDEPNQISNTRGTLSMAKTRGATSFGSQWFINLKDNPGLDYNNTSGDKFYPFARVVEGMDVVDLIGQAGTPGAGVPTETITITEIVISPQEKAE